MLKCDACDVIFASAGGATCRGPLMMGVKTGLAWRALGKSQHRRTWTGCDSAAQTGAIFVTSERVLDVLWSCWKEPLRAVVFHRKRKSPASCLTLLDLNTSSSWRLTLVRKSSIKLSMTLNTQKCNEKWKNFDKTMGEAQSFASNFFIWIYLRAFLAVNVRNLLA